MFYGHLFCGRPETRKINKWSGIHSNCCHQTASFQRLLLYLKRTMVGKNIKRVGTTTKQTKMMELKMILYFGCFSAKNKQIHLKQPLNYIIKILEINSKMVNIVSLFAHNSKLQMNLSASATNWCVCSESRMTKSHLTHHFSILHNWTLSERDRKRERNKKRESKKSAYANGSQTKILVNKQQPKNK